jgi:hypothetical protein
MNIISEKKIRFQMKEVCCSSRIAWIFILAVYLISCHKEDPSISDESLTDYYADAAKNIDNRIKGLEKQGNILIFSKQDHKNREYLRNNQCWAADFDLSCISPWNSRDGNLRAGTLITPRHILLAAHYNLKAGDTIRFVSKENRIEDRLILKHKNYTDWQTNYPDITVCLLEKDLPSDFTPCLFLPENYGSYIKNEGKGLPVICTDQEEKALVSDLSSLCQKSLSAETNMFVLAEPEDPARALFYESKMMGDSGNPVFLVLKNKLVLIGVLTYGGPGSGTALTYFANLNAINAGLDISINKLIFEVDSLAGINTGHQIGYFGF